MYNLVEMNIMASTKINRNPWNEFLLSVLAGITIGIGCIGLGFVKSDTPLFYSVSGLLGGFIFSFGLFSIFRLGFELFTGNCLLLISVLDGRKSWKQMFKVLGINLLGNVIGCLMVAMIFVPCGFSFTAMIEVMSKTKATTPPIMMFFRAILCNIVICVATIISQGTNNTTSKFIAASIATMIFVACGFEHSIADSFIMSAALLANVRIPMVSILIGLFTFVIVVIGNVVGGFLVGWLYYEANNYSYNEIQD